MAGSSNLTDEQQDWYLNRFGVRYLAVAEQPLRLSRRVRRGRGTAKDAPVLEAQQQAQKRLANAQTRPA